MIRWSGAILQVSTLSKALHRGRRHDIPLCRRTCAGRRAAAVCCLVVVFPSVPSALPLAKLFEGFNPLREMRAFFLHLVQADPLCRDDAVENLLVTRRQGANAY